MFSMSSPPHLRAKKYKQQNHHLTYQEFEFIMKNLPVQVAQLGLDSQQGMQVAQVTRWSG
jgi:hypothetical protein